MVKVFTTVCLAICILSQLESSFGMESSDGRVSKAIWRSEDRVASASAPYNIGILANDLHYIFKEMSGSSQHDALNDEFSKLAKMEASDEFINDFIVIKHKSTEKINYAESLFAMLRNLKNAASRIGSKLDSRPTRTFDPERIYYDAHVTDFGSSRVYGNLARYSHKEVFACLDDAFKQMSEECGNGSKVDTCSVSSLVCGLYYGTDPAKIRLRLQRAERYKRAEKYYNVNGNIVRVPAGGGGMHFDESEKIAYSGDESSRS